MPFLPRKGILAIAAVVDIALNDRERPVSAKTLAVRHGLPPRHLEPVLQALVRDGILKGIRGPGGGYELAAEPREITAEQILRAAELIDEGPAVQSNSPLVVDIVLPAVAHAEKAL
jgi:Rrf2 family iron-sulfur cluster assembly transcriptional regulator